MVEFPFSLSLRNQRGPKISTLVELGTEYVIEYNRYKLPWMGKQTLFRQLTRFVELDPVRTRTNKNVTINWNGVGNFVASDCFKGLARQK